MDEDDEDEDEDEQTDNNLLINYLDREEPEEEDDEDEDGEEAIAFNIDEENGAVKNGKAQKKDNGAENDEDEDE